MRVSLVSETYFPQVNGVSRTLGHLVRVLTERGDQVQLVTPDYGDMPVDEHHRMVRSVNLPFYRELYLPLPPFGAVRKSIDGFGPDLVHLATEATLGLHVLRHALKKGYPTVSSFHTNFDQYTEHYRLGWARGTIWRYLRWFHNQTRETYVPSEATASQLEARGFERLALWPRGVDARLFRPDRPNRRAVRESLGIGPDHVVIGHVSRIAAEKNVGYLADALEIVGRARPDVRVLVVGDGPARPALQTRLGKVAAFVGYKTGEDLADHYSASDLFAFASLTETFGNVVLEAMASGLPVVAIRAGGPAETVKPGETGRLVEPDDPPSAFAEQLIDLIDDAPGRRMLGERARAYAESRTWEAVMGGLRERYARIVESSDSSASLV